MNASYMSGLTMILMCTTVIVKFGINLEVAYLRLYNFVEAKKNISGVVVRGIVLIIIVYLLSMRVE